MKVLQYRGINSCALDQKQHKLVAMFERDDFYAADVKKITWTRYYRAKLDYKNRLLFTFFTCKNQRFILILEFIYNHAYDRSRFLRNHKISLDDKSWSLDNLAETQFAIIVLTEEQKISAQQYFNTPLVFAILSAYHLIDNLPNSLVPEFRKKRAYVASILANNEINSHYQYNKSKQMKDG